MSFFVGGRPADLTPIMKRLDQMEAKIDQRLDALSKKLDRLEELLLKGKTIADL